MTAYAFSSCLWRRWEERFSNQTVIDESIVRKQNPPFLPSVRSNRFFRNSVVFLKLFKFFERFQRRCFQFLVKCRFSWCCVRNLKLRFFKQHQFQVRNERKTRRARAASSRRTLLFKFDTDVSPSQFRLCLSKTTYTFRSVFVFCFLKFDTDRSRF